MFAPEARTVGEGSGAAVPSTWGTDGGTAAPALSRKGSAVRERNSYKAPLPVAFDLHQHGAAFLFLRLVHRLLGGVRGFDIDLVDRDHLVALTQTRIESRRVDLHTGDDETVGIRSKAEAQ